MKNEKVNFGKKGEKFREIKNTLSIARGNWASLAEELGITQIQVAPLFIGSGWRPKMNFLLALYTS